MLKRLTFIGLASLTLVGCTPTGPDAFEVTSMVLPQGHPEAGRQAFADLGCTSCHTVSWEKDLPDPVSAIRGPDLDPGLNRLTSGSVASSIIAPSHTVSAEVRAMSEDTRSPMGNYNEAMSVQQMIDIVAYLHSQTGDRMARGESALTPEEVPHHL
jgi:hypothetical protein